GELRDIVRLQGPSGGRVDIVNAGSGETRYSDMQGPGRPDIVNAGSGVGRSGYSECRVQGDQI
ncbi:unnamed protein product, partial [Staurois parvus]